MREVIEVVILESGSDSRRVHFHSKNGAITMRKSATTHDTPQQAATKRRKPAAQAQETAAHHPANWTQLSFGLNVLTWREEMKQKKKAK